MCTSSSLREDVARKPHVIFKEPKVKLKRKGNHMKRFAFRENDDGREERKERKTGRAKNRKRSSESKNVFPIGIVHGVEGSRVVVGGR